MTNLSELTTDELRMLEYDYSEIILQHKQSINQVRRLLLAAKMELKCRGVRRVLSKAPRVIELYLEAVRQCDIARELGVSSAYVSRILKKAREAKQIDQDWSN